MTKTKYEYVVTACVEWDDRPNLEILDFFPTLKQAQDYIKQKEEEQSKISNDDLDTEIYNSFGIGKYKVIQ